jgi:hypothetical protein
MTATIQTKDERPVLHLETDVLVVRENISPRAIDGATVREQLNRDGARLD